MTEIAFLTKHGKLPAVSQAFASVGYQVVAVDDFDTDELGTFTGEVARRHTPVEAAIEKARIATATSGLRYGLGSEGSFGPDPYLGVTPWGMEVIAWWDQSAARSLHAMVQGPQTNYAHCLATDLEMGLSFASQSGYPSHGLIVGRPSDACFDKEIRDLSALERAIADGLRHGPVWLETDMRAHRNPTRMVMITRAAEALALRLGSACPHCQASGFGPVGLVEGARCEDCGSVTRAARARTLQCGACGHTQEDVIRATVPAAQCPVCNP